MHSSQVYCYFRALAVKIPFVTARENLLLLFEKNRAGCGGCVRGVGAGAGVDVCVQVPIICICNDRYSQKLKSLR